MRHSQVLTLLLRECTFSCRYTDKSSMLCCRQIQPPLNVNPNMRQQNVVRTFDARNTLGSRTNVSLQDARQRLTAKTKFVDARARIQNKATTNIPNRFGDARMKLQRKKLGNMPANSDMRLNIQIAQKPKFDARANIAARKGPIVRIANKAPTTGMTVFGANGSLVKVVRTNQVAGNTPNVGVTTQGVAGGLMRTVSGNYSGQNDRMVLKS